MSDKCLTTESRQSGEWICLEPKDHTSVTVPIGEGKPRLAHYFVKRKLAICPDCRAGKHGICLGDALDEQTDQIAECHCHNVFHPGGSDA